MNTSVENIDVDKLRAVVLYIIQKMGKLDIHRLFKLMYFAEVEHLAKYGRTITTDQYTAMTYGPVPSFLYNSVKYNRNEICATESCKDLSSSFIMIDKKTIFSDSSPDLDELSNSDIKCLDNSILENKDLSMQKLTDKSHMYAWKKAKASNPNRNNNPIIISDIAKDGGASEDMINFILEGIELNRIFA